MSVPYSPEWWRDRLWAELQHRRPLVDLLEDYAEGRHKLAFATARYREAFAAALGAISDPWMALVLQAAVERIRIRGFQVAVRQNDDDGSVEYEPDHEADEWWHANGLDEEEPALWTEASKHGEAYLLTWPEGGPAKGIPRITIEHPSQVVVMRAASDRRRILAALKAWRVDDGAAPDGGETWANVYLPGRLYRWRRRDGAPKNVVLPSGVKVAEWEPRVYDDDGQQALPEVSTGLDAVPVTPITNDPHMLPCRPPTTLIQHPHRVPATAAIGLGRSDLLDVIGTQDVINKLLCDMVIAAEFGAFRQRYILGVDAEVDEDDGEEGSSAPDGGIESVAKHYVAAAERMLVIGGEGSENVKVGEFGQVDLSNYTKPVEQRIQSLASRVRVPVHYMLGGQGSFPSGESLKSAEIGLVAKCRGKHKPYGGGATRTVAIARKWAGQQERRSVPNWNDPETRTESEFVDSRVKMLALGVPPEILWRDFYSPSEIVEIKKVIREAAATGALFAPPAPPQVPEPAGG